MSSASNQAAIGLLFDVQALNQQNETQRKQMDERRRQVASEEVAIEQSTQEDIKLNKSRADGKDVLSRRQNVVRAMMKKSAKASEAKQTDKTSQGSSKTNQANKTSNKTPGKTNSKAQKNAFSEAEIKSLGKAYNDFIKMSLEAEAQGMPEFKFNPNKDNFLDVLFKKENLKGCKANNTRLMQAKAKAKRASRMFRQVAAKTLPAATNAVAKALAQKGVDLTDPKNQAPKNNNIDQSIYASIIDALEINEILQQLGVKTEAVEMDFENEMSKELLADAEKTFETNSSQIEKAHHQACMQKTLKILGDVIGALFTAFGLPEIGIPIILAANGIIEKLIQDIAKALGIPEYAIKSIIMAITIIIAIIVDAATLGTATGMCVGAVLFVAGLIGWITDTIGAIATGQLDESKFPGWVTWASLGVNIGLALITGGESLLNLVRALGNALMRAGTAAIEGLGDLCSSLADAITSIGSDTEGMAGELSEVTTGEVNGLADEGEALANSEASTGETPSTASESPPAIDAAPSDGAVSSGGESSASTASDGPASVQGGAQGSSGTPSMSTGSSASDGVGQVANGGTPSTPSEAPTSANSSSSAQPENAMTTSNTAAVRETMTNLEAISSSVDSEGEAIAPVNSSQGAPEANMEAISESQAEGTDTRSIQQKMMDFLKKSFMKMLTKLLEMKDALFGGMEDASEAAGLLKGAQTAAERAEEIAQTIQKVMRILQRLARWMLLAAQGAQAIVDFEIAQCQEELGQVLKQAAELTGETILFEQYVSTFNAVIQETKDSENQYAQDMASEIELLGAVISTQRRSSMMLMSA